MGNKVEKTNPVIFLHKHFRGFKEIVFLIGCISLLMVIPRVAAPFLYQVFVDNIIPGVNPEWGVPFIVIAGVVAVFEAMLRYVEARDWRHLLSMTMTSTSEMFWHAIRLPVGFYGNKYAGDITNRIFYGRNISDSVDKLLWLFGDLMLVVVYLYFMFRYSAFLSIFAILHIVINLLTVKIVHKKQMQTNRNVQKSVDNLQGFTASGIENIEAIKGATAEQSFFQKWSSQMSRMQKATIESTSEEIKMAALPEIFGQVFSVLILCIGSWYIMQGQLTIGMLMTFQSFMGALSRPVSHVLEAEQKYSSISAKIERMDEILSAECDVPDSLGSIEGVESGKLRGEIELRNVTFGYDRNAAPLIKNFSLHIQPGQSIAFVGPSGCGKSTLAKLISGLFQPWEGEVLLDGKPISEINRDVLANSVAVVDQNIVLFDGPIADNVKLWDDSIEDFAMVIACNDAHIHNEIVVREGNYQAKLESGGKNFSGGQRQRIELATAFAKEPSIMIMDEGTSALDAITEDLVMRSVKAMGCSQVIIAHRLSTIRDCDGIIVLRDGKVEEYGNHQQLMANGGYYSKLVEN